MGALKALFRRQLRNGLGKLNSIPFWMRLRDRVEVWVTKRWHQVNGTEYEGLFLSTSAGPPVTVDRRVWSPVAAKLPQGYRIPDMVFDQVLLSTTADHYGNLFANPKPLFGLYVNRSVWTPIKTALPEPYIIPDPGPLRSLEPMKADSYNHMFTLQNSYPAMTVDGKVWMQISSKVPKGYKLPDPAIMQVLEKAIRGVKR